MNLPAIATSRHVTRRSYKITFCESWARTNQFLRLNEKFHFEQCIYVLRLGKLLLQASYKKKSHGKHVIVSLVSNESLFFACHVSLLFNTQGSFVSKLQPIKTSHFWQGAWGRIGISEGFYFWAHEGASDVNGLIA